MGSFQDSCKIESREVTNPLLVERWEEEPMIDLRAEKKKIEEDGVLKESEADVWFCDTLKCVQKKDELLTLCGLESNDDLIENFINGLAKDYKDTHDRIKRAKESVEKQEKFLQAIAIRFGYDDVKFSEKGVKFGKKYSASEASTQWDVYPREERYKGWNS